MVFNSFAFIFLFLPITVAGFYLLARRSNGWAIGWLTLASLVFYGSWDYRYLPILLTSIVINFALCRWLLAGTGKHPQRLALAIIFNLGLLAFFKYVNFFIGTINGLTGESLATLEIILPIGISFFTFTQIAVLVDAYHGRIRELTFLHYCLFASYFPYIVAGPILRQEQMLPQLAEAARGAKPFAPRADNFAVGISIFVFGLGKKLLIADNLAAAIGPVFGGGEPQFFQAWLGMLAYSFQLYFDFSGYSDMAIGVSRCLGFTIPINFNSPYKAASISDFWQRWHISLSQFLKNYLYIPLGGNRSGQLKRYRNLILTMLLGGLWHGANWTFVIWGGLHGLYLCVQHGWQHWRRGRTRPPATPLGRAIQALWCRLLTFVAVVIAWCFFRAADVTEAIRVLAGMAGLNGVSAVSEINGAAYLMLAASAVIVFRLPSTTELFLSADRRAETSSLEEPAPLLPLTWSPGRRWGMTIGLIFALCLLCIDKTQDFIYAQF